MKILYFSWGENSSEDAISTFVSMGHRVSRMKVILQDYLYQPAVSAALEKELKGDTFDFIFSFNFIPIVSDSAQACHTKYVSWVYDCPHWTLYSPALKNECNYIFLFDREMAKTASILGAKHIQHLPLACNTKRIKKQLQITEEKAPAIYEHDISFVGNLYEHNHYNQIKYLPQNLRGYLEGMMAAQKKLWGCNLAAELLTPAKVEKLQSYLKLETDPNCPIPQYDLFQAILLAKITSDERIQFLNELAKHYDVALYSASGKRLCPDVAHKGTVTYARQMPQVFNKSKINLNITLRSIVSGIPLRAIDIMGCSGFLLTNYQPELAEYFVPDRDFVFYDSLDDLIQKAGYYLSHKKEREKIALSGYKKVQRDFSYEIQLAKILRSIRGQDAPV